MSVFSRVGQLSKQQFTLVVCVLSVIPFALAIFGVFRSYGAVPDQDLLWLSEALKLYRHAPLTYADHPGSYWSISYLLKLKLLSLFEFLHSEVVDPGYVVSEKVAAKIVYFSRLEQGFICSIVCLSAGLVLRVIGFSRLWAICAVFLLATSSGFAWESVQIRNESTSLLFYLGYLALLLFASSLATSRRRSAAIYSLILSGAFLLFSMYCKTQILLFAIPLMPLVLAWLLLKSTSNLEFMGSCEILTALAVAILGWLLLVSNAGYYPNSPLGGAWSFLNLAMWVYLIIMFSLQCRACLGVLFRGKLPSYVLCVIVGFIFFIRVFGVPIWTATVLSTPDSLMGWGGSRADLLGNALIYLRELSGGLQYFLAALLGVYSVALVVFSFRLLGIGGKASVAYCVASYYLVLFALSARMQLFYGVYVSLATVFLLSGGLVLARHARVREELRSCNSLLLLKVSGVLCCLVLVNGSIVNLVRYKSLADYSQPEVFKCFPQQMDRLMADTVVGDCPSFLKESHG